MLETLGIEFRSSLSKERQANLKPYFKVSLRMDLRQQASSQTRPNEVNQQKACARIVIETRHRSSSQRSEGIFAQRHDMS